MTQVQLRPGMMAVPMPLSPVMIFVHEDTKPFIASFPQHCIQSIEVGEHGNDAEIAFDSIPGRVFKGKVRAMLPAIGARTALALRQSDRFQHALAGRGGLPS